jgi:cytidylate kinase
MLARQMLATLRERLRARRRRSEEQRDKATVEAAVLEHELAERASHDPTAAIPPMRNNTDWGGWVG